jgi:HEPN domain-containing protein
MSDYDKYEYWTGLSDYDLVVAKDMLKAKHYLYVGFMCHQSVEKALKAVFVRDYPPENLPYVHRLLRIAESSAILNKLSQGQKKLLQELEPMNIEARYPEEKNRIFSSLTEDYCEKLIERTEEFLTWLKTS